MENGKDSNFLNKETRTKEKCKLEKGKKKNLSGKHYPLERGKCRLLRGLTVTVN